MYLYLATLIFLIGFIGPESTASYEIHFAAKLGDLDKVKELVRADKTNLDLEDEEGQTPLQVCISSTGYIKECLSEHNKFLAVIRFLLDEKANTRKGLIPALHLAAFQGNLQAVQLILDAGEDPNLETFDLITPLHVLLNRNLLEGDCINDLEIVKLLLSKGANPNSYVFGTPAIAVAKNRDMVELLLQYGAYVDSRILDSGETALHFAARNNNIEAADLLLSKGADIKACSYGTGQTPLHVAALQGHESFIFHFVSQKHIYDSYMHEYDAEGKTACFYMSSKRLAEKPGKNMGIRVASVKLAESSLRQKIIKEREDELEGILELFKPKGLVGEEGVRDEFLESPSAIIQYLNEAAAKKTRLLLLPLR